MKGKTTKRHDRRRKLATALILGAMGATAAEPAFAQDIQQISDERIEFDIAAQPLSSALSEFARQAQVNALYYSEDLRRLSSPQLRGSYTRQQALDLLLARSGYNGRISGGNLVLVEEQSSRPQQESAATNGAEPLQSAETAVDRRPADDAVIVTGTRIRGQAPVGVNVVTLDRGAIEASGRSTLQDVLQTLPQNFPGSQGELTQLGALNASRNLAFGSTVDLRGLGADATLALVNGRRLAPAGYGNFTDISVVPLAAVQRIEVLPDGASATYGSDAVGGVVNVVTRSDYEGAETSVRIGAADAMDEQSASQLYGAGWDSGHLTLAYAYRHRDALAAADRDITRDSDLTRFGGSDFSRIGGNPGTIIRVGSQTVSIPIPEGQNGTSLSQADLVAGPGYRHNENQGDFLLPEQTTHSVFAAIRQDVGARTSLFADLIATSREGYAERAQLSANLVVPASNAYRQANGLFSGSSPITIAYWMGEDLGPITIETETRAIAAAFGARIDLWTGWQGELSLAEARHEDESATRNQFESSGGIVAALASSDLALAFNPFGDGSNTNPAVLPRLTVDSLFATDSRITTWNAKAEGPLLALPGGDLRLAIGAERRDERFRLDRELVRFSGTTDDFVQSPGERTTDALFVEVFAPLVGPDNALLLVHALTLSLSVRRESPSDFEASTTPRYGVRWQPIADLTLRGAWGQSFKAPQFQQMLGGIGGSLATATAAQDPLATNGSTGILTLSGSNPNLAPERADVWTAGFDYRPAWLQGFSLEASYFDVDFSGRIAAPPTPLSALSNPQGLEHVLFRDPSPSQIEAYLALADQITGAMPADGIELIYDRRLTNLATLRVRGVDLSTAYEFATPIGDFTARLSASGLLQYESINTPGAAAIDVLDTLYNPVDWRGRASLSWRHAAWSAALSLSYLDDYRDNASTPARRISSWTTADLRLGHEWRRTDGGPGTLLALSVQNLFDEDPPFANSSIGYAFDSSNASPVGRFIAIELRQSW